MGDTPKICIVMLNYNGLGYLKRTIEPILNLHYDNFEFIVVDNGSTDGSLEFIKGVEKVKLIQSPRIREKNFACNYGINQATGEYILLLDNDALIINCDILNELVSRYKPMTGVIGLSFYDEGSSYSKSYGSYLGYYFIKENKNISIASLNEYDNCEIGYPEGKGLFISKAKWIEVGGYDDHLIFGGDDNDLGIKLWLMGYKNYLYSKSVQIHLGQQERRDNKKYSLKWMEMSYAHMYVVFKNYKIINLLITLVGITIFNFLKSLKQSCVRFHSGPFIAFFKGYYLFLKNLSITVQKRKYFQSRRVIDKDIFLKIKPPKVK